MGCGRIRAQRRRRHLAFSIPTTEEAGDKTQFDMNIYKASPSGNGSTRPVGRVWITNSDGAVVGAGPPPTTSTPSPRIWLRAITPLGGTPGR